MKNIRLSQVIEKILKDLYGIHSINLDVLLEMADKYKADLRGFHDDIDHFLNLGSTFGNHLTAGLRQQSVGLKIALAHAQILLHRPFLLSDFSDFPGIQQKRVEENIQDCLHAATSVADLVGTLYGERIFGALWVSKFSQCPRSS
jgi:hypothetical protein